MIKPALKHACNVDSRKILREVYAEYVEERPILGRKTGHVSNAGRELYSSKVIPGEKIMLHIKPQYCGPG